MKSTPLNLPQPSATIATVALLATPSFTNQKGTQAAHALSKVCDWKHAVKLLETA